MAHGADGIVIKIQSYQSAGSLASRNDSQQTILIHIIRFYHQRLIPGNGKV